VSAMIVGAQSLFFNYLKYQLEEPSGNKGPVHIARLSQLHKVMLDSLAASRTRVKIDEQLIRILDEDKMIAVRKIFRATFAIGIMQPIPSLNMLKQNPSL
jgi:hypothetical protein